MEIVFYFLLAIYILLLLNDLPYKGESSTKAPKPKKKERGHDKPAED